MKNKIVVIFAVMFFLVSLSGCGCKTNNPSYGLKLEIWGVNDDADAYSDIFKNYTKMNPRVKQIEYRKFSSDTYKKELLEALASGKGPDIFMINSTWEPSFRNKIVPAPLEVITEKMYRDVFVDLASDAFITNGQAYAVPLSVDSLALYYNKDALNEAGITNPPRTWDELALMIPRLTKFGNNGEIIKSGIAMGTAYNINRSTDILGMLMLQNETSMTSENGTLVNFDRVQGSGSNAYVPAERALNFYTRFATLGNPNYTWDPTLHYSLDAFAEGSVAMMFNYSYHLSTIKSKSPKLNFTVAPVPQASNNHKVDFGNCWGYVVALNKKAVALGADPTKVNISDQARILETWKFLKYLTLRPEENVADSSGSQTVGGGFDANLDAAKAYADKTKKPAARKDLIEWQKGEYELGVFAEQNLIAKNWIQIDPDATESIMAEMIDDVNRGKFGTLEAIQAAVSRINRAIK